MTPSRFLLFVAALSSAVFLPGCPSDNGANDAGLDATPDAPVSDAQPDATGDAAPADAAPDVVYPPGPQGDILRIGQTADWTLPTLRGPVQVVSVEAGIPHIYASNERDLHVVMGFIHARDRYFQMELTRRYGLGVISELLGDAGLASDQASRGRGSMAIADRILAQLTPEQADLLDAYAEGINAAIDATKAYKLPVATELNAVQLLLGARNPRDLMQHLSRRDVAAMFSAVLFNSSFTTDDLDRSRIAATLPTLFAGAVNEPLRIAGVRDDIFDWVTPVYPVTSAPAFGLEGGTLMASRAGQRMRRVRARDGAPAHVPADVMARALAQNAPFERLRRGAPGSDYGSNAWAIGASGTPDGAAILAGDGHLPLSVPALLHQMGTDTTVFGDPATGQRMVGLFFPGIPIMPIGTNGSVAFDFTYLYGDLTDWYAERIRLGADGKPADSFFQGSWRPMMVSADSYNIADVPALNSVGRTESWQRWTTFDGRWLASIEGRTATRDTVLGPGEALIEVQGALVIPGDTDGDGNISAVTFDYTGFDVSNLFTALREADRAHTVADFRTAQHRFVGFAQNFVAADGNGNVYYSGYTGTPCRQNLPRNGGQFADGANPRLLLDGTQYGAFTIGLDANGLPDESQNTTDPSHCVVPFDRWPSSLNPSRGYVLTANNDIGGISIDGSLANDEYYLGGPWAEGYRAQTINTSLAAHHAARDGSIDAMAALQADHVSHLGIQFLPYLTEAVDAARALTSPTTPAETRLRNAYLGEQAAIDEAMTRIATWLGRGATAASGVQSFYDSPTPADQADAVATMIFNAWFRELNNGIFGDENIDAVLDFDPRFTRTTSLTRFYEGRGAGNPRNLASYDPATQESAFFDVLGTPEVETSREVTLTALVRALQGLREAPTSPGVGGFGTSDMNQYLWGLRHQVAFESILIAFAGNVMGVGLIADQMKIAPSRIPLAMNLPTGDPRKDLPWFPRPGDWLDVDAANPPVRGDYVYRTGPVMRMVVELNHGHVRGQNIIPAGQSGIARSPNFDDQVRLWLGNRAFPMRYDVADVVAGATGRESFHP